MSVEVARQTYPFSLPDLPYSYEALEPHVDQKTLQLHHREHHATYVKKLNEAVAKHDELHRHTLSQLLQSVATLPPSIQTPVRNNGGGHLNHDFFWRSLTPGGSGQPRGKLADAVHKQFGSLQEFRQKFADVATAHFASGWAALALDHASGNLEIVDLHDHETLPAGEKTGLLIVDVWEHAYYLKYQNRRPEFIEAFWNIVNWPRAEEVFARSTASL